MHSQAQLEHRANDALAALGAMIDHATVSDAVDLYLCKLERDTGKAVDRDAITTTVAAQAIETATAWLLAISEPPRTHRAGATPARP